MTMKTVSDITSYHQLYRESVTNPESFWSSIAEDFSWKKKWSKVLEWDFHKPEVKWFIGGKLNITENCIDRHLPKRAKQTAIIWEPNNPKDKAKHITYKELHTEVSRVGNMLKA